MDPTRTPRHAADIPFEHGYAALPPRFFQPVAPTPVAAPRWLAFNDALAAELGIADVARDDALLALLAGNAVPQNTRPIAMAYAGHQFGQFVPQLGDGRAILLGELDDVHGRRRDVQLKGAGPTAFSRRGDGRAAIGPVLREFVVSEAMHALGVPTTRALAAVASGEHLLRDGPVPGAVLTRVAASHVRIGTFEYFAARNDLVGAQALADHVIDRLYPVLHAQDRPVLALLDHVADRQAALVARWLQVGFVHGVMNTDNVALSGETLDYGPCAFLDEYDPAKVFSSIDRGGRYAYGNQAAVMQWNLARLAEALLPLVDGDGDTAFALVRPVIEEFPARFAKHWLDGMRGKLGLVHAQPGDLDLVQDLLGLMQARGSDYTLAFRGLASMVDADEAARMRTLLAAVARGDDPGDDTPLPQVRDDATDPVARALAVAALPDGDGFDAWLPRWRARLAQERDDPAASVAALHVANPAVIARNHRVEAAIVAAKQGDLAPFDGLLAAVRRPFAADADALPWMTPPTPGERVLQTFCGT